MLHAAKFNFTSSFQKLMFCFYIWMAFHFILYLMQLVPHDKRFWSNGLKLEALSKSERSRYLS